MEVFPTQEFLFATIVALALISACAAATYWIFRTSQLRLARRAPASQYNFSFSDNLAREPVYSAAKESSASAEDIIVCPSCKQSGAVDCSDGAFGIRGVMPKGFPEGAVRKCTNCNSGVRVFLNPSSERLSCDLIPEDLWKAMVAVWEREFGVGDEVAVDVGAPDVEEEYFEDDAEEEVPDIFEEFIEHQKRKMRPIDEILREEHPGLDDEHYQEIVDVKEKVASWLVDTLGDKVISYHRGLEAFPFGSIYVNVLVRPSVFQGDGMEAIDRTNVVISSILLRRVPLTEKLINEVALTPPPGGYGAVHLQLEEGDNRVAILYGTTLFARNLEKEDFMAFCQMIANISDRLARSFQAEFGGEFFGYSS